MDANTAWTKRQEAVEKGEAEWLFGVEPAILSRLCHSQATHYSIAIIEGQSCQGSEHEGLSPKGRSMPGFSGGFLVLIDL